MLKNKKEFEKEEKLGKTNTDEIIKGQNESRAVERLQGVKVIAPEEQEVWDITGLSPMKRMRRWGKSGLEN